MKNPYENIAFLKEMSEAPENESAGTSDVEVSKGKKDIYAVNNVIGLWNKFKSIHLNLDWIEKLDISIAADLETTKDVLNDPDSKAEDDFKREMAFYHQALAVVGKAVKRLRKLNVPTKRPIDYFAEMAKSDEHMKKVREKLLSKQTAVERREQVRAIREQKKMGKKIQHEIVEGKKSEKKKMINALKKTKKGKMGADALLKPEQSKKPQKGKKFREFRDNKYGYGGKKKGSKWNTADSTAESSQNRGQSNIRSFKNKKFTNNKQRTKHRRRR